LKITEGGARAIEYFVDSSKGYEEKEYVSSGVPHPRPSAKLSCCLTVVLNG
jgi:hypothetical protein